MRLFGIWAACCSVLATLDVVFGIQLDVNDPESVKSAASTVAHKMMTFYHGNESGVGIPGLLGDPYYWWEAGGMFQALINYWYYTGDTSYNAVTTEAMLFQTGPYNDYMPPNQSKSLGNDDQSYWGFAAMSAAELRFPNPPPKQAQWLALAQAVFNSQAARWDTSTCGGGLKWQIFTFNAGYDYKNSPSNGCFFTLAARLYAYTGNTTYRDWAVKSYEWSLSTGLIDAQYDVWDGIHERQNCTDFEHWQWTYNYGVYIYGAAVMWNVTQQDIWKERALGIWQSAHIFFTGGDNNTVMYEATCEINGKCDTDQFSFKAYTSRWLAVSMQLAPWMDVVKPYLIASANAAAQSCTGGDDKITCGTRWYNNTGWDGTTGVGQQMSALEVIGTMLIQTVQGPVTNTTGGNSTGDYSAGTGPDTVTPPLRKITTADKAGAGILTALLLAGTLAGAWYINA